jgi:hypothetical protein
MKKLLLLGIMSFVFVSVNAQKVEKLNEFKASNGVTYKVGDQIKLGRGSGANGAFVYVTIGGWGMVASGKVTPLPPSDAGLIVTIKKIRKYNYKHYKGVYFTVGGGNITNYNVDIENAIATGEIFDPKAKKIAKEKGNAVPDKYDELMKIKKLFDQGVLTKEEYEAEKKKILGGKK